MTRLRPALVFALISSSFATPARAEDVPVKATAGDLVNGGRLHELHCAACHGLGASGEGPLAASLEPKPPATRDGAYLWSRPDSTILATILGDAGKKSAPPYHGRGLSELDARDILAWIVQPVPGIRDFFLQSSDFIAHRHAYDQFGLERAEKAMGAPLAENEKTIMVYTVFKADEPAEGETAKPLPPRARLIPEEPALLYQAKPRRKIGFVGFAPLNLDGGTFQVGLAFNRSMRLFDVRTVPTGDAKSEELRRKLEPTIRAYIGSGGREDKKPVEPQTKGVKASKDLQREMVKAYTRVLEGAAMYEKEERDRFWADPDAFKFPGAQDQPEDVKFEFKQKK